MAGQRATKRNRKSRDVRARRRRRVVGLGCSAGALFAFGVGPLGVAPTAAPADEFGAILDPIINSITGWLEGVDPSAGLAGLDLGGLGVDPSAGLAGLDLGGLGLDPSSAADSAASVGVRERRRRRCRRRASRWRGRYRHR